jgi:hypothetical protein
VIATLEIIVLKIRVIVNKELAPNVVLAVTGATIQFVVVMVRLTVTSVRPRDKVLI